MGFLKFFKRKNSSKTKTTGKQQTAKDQLGNSSSDVVINSQTTNVTSSDSFLNKNQSDVGYKNEYNTSGVSDPSEVRVPTAAAAISSSASVSSISASTKRKSSFSLLKKSSFGTIDTSISHHNSNDIKAKKVTDLPAELVPVVTLINHQQTRSYYKGNSYFYHQTAGINTNDWSTAYVELSGSDVSVRVENNPTTYINVCDCELALNKIENLLSISVTNESILSFKFNTPEELETFYSAVLLCKFEYQQLQEAYTGALLSSQAIHFSDIKTLLSPNNKNIKEEWSVIRFPFLNDKWIRCLIVIKPNNKVEIYTNSNKSKKYLLATITNGQSAYTIYANDPSQVQNNSLLRLYGNCYINNDLLDAVICDDIDSVKSKKMRSRTGSLSKRLSLTSMKSDEQKSVNMHKRTSSIDTTISDNSFNNSKTPKKLVKKNLIKSHLIYIIPESHASVRPCEIMLRMLIPILNSFSLYGRPSKFISSRTDPNSLLFGLPQLPNTYYLNNKSANDLVHMNIEHSLIEDWSSSDWNFIFKELLSTLMEKGWKGGSYDGDIANLNISLQKPVRPYDENSYDPMEDFIDRASSANRSVSIPA